MKCRIIKYVMYIRIHNLRDVVYCFFFSSRRRHTRCSRDWSSDVCSSDLVLMLALGIGATTSLFSAVYGVLIDPYPYAKPGEIWTPGLRSATANQRMRPYQIGRASCRERV